MTVRDNTSERFRGRRLRWASHRGIDRPDGAPSAAVGLPSAALSWGRSAGTLGRSPGALA